MTPDEKTDPDKLIEPRYYVSKSLANNLFVKYKSFSPKWFLLWRDVARATDERTAIAAIIPKVPASVTCPGIGFCEKCNGALLAANLNTLAFDYFARLNTGGIHLNWGILEQLPMLAPNSYYTRGDLVGGEKWITLRVLELTYTAWDLQPFARDCGYDGPPFRWDEARRFLLRCELDAAYFHLYGIERDDVDYILETFPIVKRKEIAKHGEFRTKRVILEMYDAMADAMQGGAPYATRLEPPPADRRVAHEG